MTRRHPFRPLAIVSALAAAVVVAPVACTSTSRQVTATATQAPAGTPVPTATCPGTCVATSTHTPTIPGTTLTFLATSSYSPTPSATVSPTIPFVGSSTFTRTVTQTMMLSPTRTPSRTATRTNTTAITPTFTSVTCPGTTLTSSVAVVGSTGGTAYCLPINARWAGIAIQAQVASEDWDLDCFLNCGSSTPFGSSAAGSGTTDYGVWNGNVLGAGYCTLVESLYFSGSSGYDLNSWSNNGATSIVAGTNGTYALGGTLMIRVWECALVSGTAYSFSSTAPAAFSLRLHAPGAGSNQLRSAAVGVATGGASFNYTATSTGNHGVVMVSNSQASSNFTITRTP